MVNYVQLVALVGPLGRPRQDKFHDSIAQLLHTFPLDHKTSEGTLFWSGPKRPPQPLMFDANDEVHVEFVVACANLYAANLGLAQNSDRAAIAGMAGRVELAPFQPKEVKIKVDDKDTTVEGCMDDEARETCDSDGHLGLRSIPGPQLGCVDTQPSRLAAALAADAQSFSEMQAAKSCQNV